MESMARDLQDNIYVLSELVQERLREGKKTYAFFLDVQKAYDMVWRNGLWVKMWELGVRGIMWRVIKEMYRVSRSAVLLDDECSEAFDVQQGVAQGCSLSPILFSVFINGLLKEVEQHLHLIYACTHTGGLLYSIYPEISLCLVLPPWAASFPTSGWLSSHSLPLAGPSSSSSHSLPLAGPSSSSFHSYTVVATSSTPYTLPAARPSFSGPHTPLVAGPTSSLSFVPTSSVARMHPPVADPSSSSSLVAPTVTISLSRASTLATTTGLQVYFVHKGVCLMYRFLFTLPQSLMSRHPVDYSLRLPQGWPLVQNIWAGLGVYGLFVAKGKMTSQLKLWWYLPAYEAPEAFTCSLSSEEALPLDAKEDVADQLSMLPLQYSSVSSLESNL